MNERVQASALVIASVLISVLALEAAARAWVALTWPDGLAYSRTHATGVRVRFAADRWNGYGLTPSYRSRQFNHNARAFRGPELRAERAPGVVRVAIVGASTVYGDQVMDAETSSVQLQHRLANAGIRAEVVNAGVPGWTTVETVRSLEHRVLPLRPDVVVIMDGRNDAFPEVWRDYRDDYTHYRNQNWVMKDTNLGWKPVFRMSYLSMVILHEQEWFGYSAQQENPVYGVIRFENQPTLEEAREHVSDAHRFRGFTQHLQRSIDLVRAAGAIPVLATVPYRKTENYRSGVLKPPYESTVAIAVRRNQELVRELAATTGVSLVDTPDLWTAEYLLDDCHFNPKGEQAFADRLFEVVEPLVRHRGSLATLPDA